MRHLRRHFPKLLRFLFWGLPAFLLAVPLNYALVMWAGLSKPLAYACVLVAQVTLNFFLCRQFVFAKDPGVGLWKSFAVFLNGILLFRLLDWGLYSVLTVKCGAPMIAAQLFNVGLFGLLKFEFSRRVFEREKPALSHPNATRE